MRYWESAEVERSVDDSLTQIRDLLRQPIEDALAAGQLANCDLELCYIPIIMGPDSEDFYPARSSLDLKSRKAFHSPALSFEVFKSGSKTEKVNAHLDGLILASELLLKAGLETDLIGEFEQRIGSVRNKYGSHR